MIKGCDGKLTIVLRCSVELGSQAFLMMMAGLDIDNPWLC